MNCWDIVNDPLVIFHLSSVHLIFKDKEYVVAEAGTGTRKAFAIFLVAAFNLWAKHCNRNFFLLISKLKPVCHYALQQLDFLTQELYSPFDLQRYLELDIFYF